MPSIEHEETITYLKDTLEKELEAEGIISLRGEFSNMIPDLTFRDKAGKHIVIEVGTTDAIKIAKYQEDTKVREIRWYTKNRLLVGKWIREESKWTQVSECIDWLRFLDILKQEVDSLEVEINRRRDKLRSLFSLPSEESVALTCLEVSRMLHTSKTWVKEQCDKGEIPSVIVAGETLILHRTLEEWLKVNEVRIPSQSVFDELSPIVQEAMQEHLSGEFIDMLRNTYR